MNRAEIVERIKSFLEGRNTVEELYKWYFAEHLKMATHDAEMRQQCLSSECAPDGSDDMQSVVNSIFLDLDAYRGPLEEKSNLTIDEAELRRRLGRHLSDLMGSIG